MIQTWLYSNNVWKQKIWQENIPKIDVEKIKSNGRFYPYLYSIKDLVQENIQACMCASTKESF
jgi:hypothetical protein